MDSVEMVAVIMILVSMGCVLYYAITMKGPITEAVEEALKEAEQRRKAADEQQAKQVHSGAIRGLPVGMDPKRADPEEMGSVYFGRIKEEERPSELINVIRWQAGTAAYSPEVVRAFEEGLQLPHGWILMGPAGEWREEPDECSFCGREWDGLGPCEHCGGHA